MHNRSISICILSLIIYIFNPYSDIPLFSIFILKNILEYRSLSTFHYEIDNNIRKTKCIIENMIEFRCE